MTKPSMNCVLKEQNPVEMDKKTESSEHVADFETAINAAGFGFYNIMLLVVSIFAMTSTFFKIAVMSYVIPSADCDLELTLLEKGALNAMVFAGMIPGGIFWGYISDTRGRRHLLIIGYTLNSICVLCEAMSQSVLQLQIFLFIGGFILCGLFAIMLTYLTEMHSKTYRPRVVSFVGVILSVAALLLAVLSLLILTKSFTLNIFSMQVRPWQLYIAISGIPSLVSGILLGFFPESPKFLMSHRENDEALKVFQLIYSINYHKPKTDYPITQLVDEFAETTANQESDNQNNTSTAFAGFKQFRPLFGKQYLCNSLLIYLMSFSVSLGANSFRLWLPQLFASISEYHVKYPLDTATMCKVIEYSVNKSQAMLISNNDNKICETVFNVDAAYNNIYVGITGVVGFTMMGYLVTILTRRTILFVALVTAPILIFSTYFITSMLTIIIFACIISFIGTLVITSMLDYASTLFPTALRAMIISLVITCGRIGTLTGNLLFPVFMKVHCIAPFVMMSSLYLLGLLCSIFLPNTHNKSLV